ncbi:helix-turn-helix domain-containing protein [Flagellimonas hymeniacidonis]|uniref:Helix-turn-helix domain-containing protein n=1 Tax=Flagellimonas hymeniacidonis TaxID=2603628 RepID=A0A5C8V7X8_9FLAO|nr:helix-turn-helix domain-containing protein [Flagellimonas hymeniacidonis]TXN36898.1 helix-turn-helix domain-containing protein [Flagellimonas hymeniacidonis]
MESITQVHNITPENLVERLASKILSCKSRDNILKPVWKYITRKEAAKKLEVSYMTLDSWDKKGILKKRKIGDKVFYKLEEIEALLDNSMG